MSFWEKLVDALVHWIQRCTTEYDPAKWNTSTARPCNNCYNYACDIKTDTFAQPGMAHGTSLPWPDGLNCKTVSAAAVADGLRRSNVPSCGCSDCCHAVALVVDPGNDYHWYRLDRDGKWSHKPGHSPATNLDNSGHIITDPRTADRGTYTEFCGFFCVCKPNIVSIAGAGCDLYYDYHDY